MASRQQEKQRRREERLERERAAAAAAQRRKRLQLAFGALLGLLLVAGTVVLVAAGLGGSSGGTQTSNASHAKLPPQRISDLTAAAKAAGCTVQSPPDEGRTHVAKDLKPSDYDSNPPTSGPHNPDWYQDGIYAPGDTPRLGMLVHPLEHGRIEVQYRRGTSPSVVGQLEALLGQEDGGYHMLLFQNTTGMRYEVAATAWDHLLGCPRMNDRVFDALRSFRTTYIDKGPEKVP